VPFSETLAERVRWLPSLAVFGAGGLLLFVATRVAIPWLAARTSVEPIVLWFLVGGLGVFAPLVAVAALLLRREGWWGRPGLWAERLRFRPMNAADWGWSLGALLAVGVGYGAVAAAGAAVLGRPLAAQPPFMALEPLGPGRLWILAAWVPFWVLNILGEELLWRGVLLPRQEAALGRWAWVANGAGWLLFHLAFGGELVVLLVPILVVLPWVAQRRRSTWVAVAVHGGLNGPGFVAVAFGWV
jgi:membrane protease YdiL (CAAX protease family)